MALVSTLFGFTGDWQRFNVPNNVHTVYVTAIGGGASGQVGGIVSGSYKVRPSDVLWVAVGRRGFGASGKNGGAQCWPNGGKGADGGSAARNGGDGGGGGSFVRLNGPGGELVAVAAGAGGNCGDGSTGGRGGGNHGEDGHRADSSANFATGGGQVHGGNGGRIGSNTNFNGENAADDIGARGGSGGFAGNDKAHGGGGGGGGYRSGGGGQAGKAGSWYGGGGGGGSNYADPLHDVSYNGHSPGLVDHGVVQIAWYEGGDLPPNTPGDTKINGVAESSEMLLRTNDATISAKPTDSTTDQKVRIFLYLSKSPLVGSPGDGQWSAQSMMERTGTWDPSGERDFIDLHLDANTLYHGRLYSQDHRGQRSAGYVGLKFWTDQAPNAPVNTSPSPDTEFDTTDSIVFDWTNSDPDQDTGFPETPNGWGFRWRVAGSAFKTTGEWNVGRADGNITTATVPASSFPVGAQVEWSVASRVRGLWSGWSTPSVFSIVAVALPPIPNSPVGFIAQYASEPTLFTWQFRTQITGERQVTADLRYRAYGTLDWTTLDGDEVVPGTGPRWLVDEETFAENELVEWQARTHTTSDTVSEWSTSAYFWSVRTPGLAMDPIPLDWTRSREVLGEGVNRVYLYQRGGEIPLGELTPLVDVKYGRKRDDMESCTIHINQWSDDTIGTLLRIKSWATELVVFRTVAGKDPERVFEGPVVRINDTANGLEVEAKDVMAYVYRRLMRQGYNDSYQCQTKDAYGNCLDQLGLHTVVHRAERIIVNALAYDDPNVLPYLTAIHNTGDAIQSRIVKAYSKTAWEEVDDMAANAGLDYTTVGRRIILNDTHRPIGRLPEMSNKDFSERPVITEYGMSYATDWAVTNNNGLYGLATRGRDPAHLLPPNIVLTGDAADTGYVEQIASQYGESDDSGIGTDDLTPAEIAAIQATLATQAERNIASRYPMPRVVRVPDNANLLPSSPVGINQLVPGVWIPLRAKGLILEASQWQKLDSMSVRQDSAGEKVSVVMSPAPNGGADPDAELAQEEV